MFSFLPIVGSEIATAVAFAVYNHSLVPRNAKYALGTHVDHHSQSTCRDQEHGTERRPHDDRFLLADYSLVRIILRRMHRREIALERGHGDETESRTSTVPVSRTF